MFQTRLTFLAVLLTILTCILPDPSGAQSAATLEPETATSFAFPLTISSIMRGPELVGQPPMGIQWSDDSRWIYFRWLPGGRAWNDDPELYRVPARGGEPEKVDEDAADDLAITFARGALSPDRKLRLSSMGGDLYLVERGNLRVTRLTDTEDAESAVGFTGDGKAIFFLRADNLYEMTLDGGLIRQLTDVREGTPPRDPEEATGQKGFLENQQEKLFETIRRRKAEQEEREEEREKAREGEPEPLYLPRGERAQGLDPTPDAAFVAVTVYKPAEGAQRVIVPNWVTESGYTEDLNVRTKVGDANGSSRVGILEVATGKTTWLDLYPADDAEEEGGEGRRSPSEDPDLSMAGFIGWNDAGTRGLLFSVSYDNKTRWLFTVDAATGELTLLDTLHDEAWVAGPCSFGCTGWLPDSDRIYFGSEETGYSHIYTINADGTGKRALTSGEWEVLDLGMPEDRSYFLLHTNEGSPFNQHVYTMRFDGSRREAITSGTGSFEATLSPNGRRMAVVHSRANRPPELYVAELEPEPELAQVTVSPTAEWLTFPWLEPEIVHFPAEDGTRVPARIYRPSEVGAEANGAAVIFVHGAGYLHNVHNFWSTYYREYMFNHFLAANGYTVLDIDYRGSAGYGRDWRTAIYRWMGGKDLSDQVDGAGYLVREEGVDPDRIGLYGGSYGGFITLMALFTAPETFKAGAALRSVTDWAHYNHGYTSDILNFPQNDPEAYEKSSPIYFAENFQGHLLMAHGMVDTNVHFSDVVRLAQRLIELGKENWELAVYPVENHGFVEPTSWTDEYRRIFELFERTISAPGCTEGGGLCRVRMGGGRKP
jgi:dipeptidyl aminopeptidase/acylaminoacyl peptidase